MTAHNIQNYGIATKPAFDELFQEERSKMITEDITKTTSRLVSADNNSNNKMNLAAPITPSSGEESAAAASMSITGTFSAIEYKYHVDPRVIGTGHHGSVRECMNRVTGERFAVKSIRKSDKSVKPHGLAREILLLSEMKHIASCSS